MSSQVFDTPEAIEYFRMCSIRGRLQIESETGIKFRLPTLVNANRIYGTNFRYKKQMIDYLTEKIEEAKKGVIPVGPDV